ncbi:formate--tetrahydrofolate ligase [Dichotomicrobium thermohalophilum]|uniref:Formate--tetrahydrofolate ligase n=1 Tax=Dichotomicrobium thermohalophilum TaxID=933063 RepID=A0A397QDC5_9HYPH|nr:formate--tetrahydrofolate ligase [Dichotomicrobium thermohalophilum]RIA56261.1 formate-tetrahydrofolate ligase [Dichotomicrobium thermohalophilum]
MLNPEGKPESAAETAAPAKKHGSDLEIARAAHLRPIRDVAARLDVPEEALYPFGHHIGKIEDWYLQQIEDRPDGKLILVTAITPTPAGEGKTTMTIGLGDGLNRIGARTAMCIREPSLGPCFGMKGGAAGGGYAQVVPMETINLHFTGDFHAITAAHNLLAAMLDNHMHWGNAQDIDPRRVAWRRVLDMNDRALRRMVIGLGGPTEGVPREDGFDITVASEVMAIFCLAKNFDDLHERLGAMVIGYRRDKSPVYARDIEAPGAMSVLLQQAFNPNLVQTLENNPAFVHGGPFANIAHGCNTVRATRAALKLSDYVVTEAGFGADLGAEKFFDIKCRKAGLNPSAAVVVATVRALKMHGGVDKADLGKPNVEAVRAGAVNLGRHIENLRKFGVPLVVGINRFGTDTEEELQAVVDYCAAQGVEAYVCTHWADGSAGSEAIAARVRELADGETTSRFAPLYSEELSVEDKIRKIASELYRAGDVVLSDAARAEIRRLTKLGYGNLPVCMAKTQYSFSSDPALRGAPEGHTLEVREVRLSAGAGFIVVVCGSIMTMPGLPKVPAANAMYVNENGQIENLS